MRKADLCGHFLTKSYRTLIPQNVCKHMIPALLLVKQNLNMTIYREVLSTETTTAPDRGPPVSRGSPAWRWSLSGGRG